MGCRYCVQARYSECMRRGMRPELVRPEGMIPRPPSLLNCLLDRDRRVRSVPESCSPRANPCWHGDGLVLKLLSSSAKRDSSLVIVSLANAHNLLHGSFVWNGVVRASFSQSPASLPSDAAGPCCVPFLSSRLFTRPDYANCLCLPRHCVLATSTLLIRIRLEFRIQHAGKLAHACPMPRG